MRLRACPPRDLEDFARKVRQRLVTPGARKGCRDVLPAGVGRSLLLGLSLLQIHCKMQSIRAHFIIFHAISWLACVAIMAVFDESTSLLDSD